MSLGAVSAAGPAPAQGGTYLDRILAVKRREVAKRRERIPLRRLQQAVQSGEGPADCGLLASALRVWTGGERRPFAGALRRRAVDQGVALIAEIKRASPSKGALRADLDPARVAASYASGGAAALSVLTDRSFFQGSEEDLVRARAACGLPVLRKDFILDPYQLWESRVLGADAVLLIVAALEDGALRELLELAGRLELDALVEVHDEEELERAVDAGATLIGINNRNLRTFETRLETTLHLAPRLPAGAFLVSESGIHSAEDLCRVLQAGAGAVLVGEALVRSDDPGQAVRQLLEGVPGGLDGAAEGGSGR